MQPVGVGREGIDPPALCPEHQAQGVQGDRCWAVERLVGQDVDDRQPAAGAQGIEQPAEQATVGIRVEQMAEITGDRQIVARSAPLNVEAVASQVRELSVAPSGGDGAPCRVKHRW